MKVHKQIFILEGKYIILEKDIGESIERFTERAYFILHYMKDKNSKFEETLNLSRVWANIKFDGCTYSNKLHELVKNYLT